MDADRGLEQDQKASVPLSQGMGQKRPPLRLLREVKEGRISNLARTANQGVVADP